jgi:hypothetical protein
LSTDFKRRRKTLAAELKRLQRKSTTATPGADSFASAQVALGLGKTFAFQSPILCLALQLAEVYVGADQPMIGSYEDG